VSKKKDDGSSCRSEKLESIFAARDAALLENSKLRDANMTLNEENLRLFGLRDEQETRIEAMAGEIAEYARAQTRLSNERDHWKIAHDGLALKEAAIDAFLDKLRVFKFSIGDALNDQTGEFLEINSGKGMTGREMMKLIERVTVPF
jgi:hypothetical protein